ncbi:uncharacterized protein LOC129409780 isoform X4 [Boleophthalmus pectinirostris]|uniref:uncharacterized protein LOC129409780 isoform X4 n=1 Tax=Boleophthalmus pectinirostris TaxID=150288 RepID=UPI002432E5FD|nr:uncharacterized protein LOC129409780 isoform X4 [Boleophthalmus pectinirostris]
MDDASLSEPREFQQDQNNVKGLGQRHTWPRRVLVRTWTTLHFRPVLTVEWQRKPKSTMTTAGEGVPCPCVVLTAAGCSVGCSSPSRVARRVSSRTLLRLLLKVLAVLGMFGVVGVNF